MPFTPRAQVQSVVQTTINTSASLASSPAAGATTFTLNAVPSGLMTGSIVAVDAYTTQCELRTVTGVSGSTVTVARLMFAHTAGDALVVLPGAWATVELFGLTGDQTDEWAPLQRLVKETTNLNIQLRGNNGVFYFQQPLAVNTSSWFDHLTIRTRSGFAPVEAVGAAVMVGNGEFFFKATASDNTFTATESDHTTPTASGLTIDIPIVFNAPYGETLPGSVTSGKVYYVKSLPTANTFTVSATFQGSTLDVTSDGTGWSVNNVTDGLARVYWERLYLFLTIADLNGVWATVQQPGWTRNMRIDMQAAASTQGAATGFKLDGQISYNDNVEINTNTNCVGMSVAGTGHSIRGFNDNGVNNGDTGMVLSGDSNCVDSPWTESVGRAGIEIASGRGLVISGTWVFVPQVAVPGLLVTSDQSNYDLGVIRSHTTAELVSDTARGLSISSYTSDLVGETDISFAFFGLRQGYGASISPELKHRWQKGVTTDYTVQRSTQIVRAAGTHTITLPTCVGWRGHQTTIYAIDATTIDPVGSETIDGSPTLALTAGQAVTVVSDGASNYEIVGQVT